MTTILKDLFPESTWPIKAKFYAEPPWEGGKKVYINCPGHMTKMAATPIYGKNLQNSPPNCPISMKLGMEYYELKLYTIYIKDDPELTLTYFTAMSNWRNLFLY